MPVLPQDGYWDQRALERALTLAEEAAAFASPNPAVGCVLTFGTTLLGEGAHRYDQRDHAEIAALKAAALAGRTVHGATAYVTLEPCSHHGRTGPCADALIAAGIARCFIATADPNPLVRGGGLSKLRAAGIVVEVLEPASRLALRARRLNDAFAFSIQHGRPFVTLKSAVSEDGKLAPPAAKRSGAAPFWLTGSAARSDVQKLRHRADAVLTGIGTVLADDPALTDRTGLPRRRPLLRVVLDSSLRTPPDSALVRSAAQDLLVFCSSSVPSETVERLRANGADVVQLAAVEGRLPLERVLAVLAAIPVRSVLLEAGSALNAAFLNANLVDRVVLYRAPATLGPEAVPFAEDLPLDTLEMRLLGRQTSSFLNGDAADVRTTGYLHDPWTGFEENTSGSEQPAGAVP